MTTGPPLATSGPELTFAVMTWDLGELRSLAKTAGAQALGKLPTGAAQAALRLAGEYEIDGYVLDPHLRLVMLAAESEPSIHTMDVDAARDTSSRGFAVMNAPRVEGIRVSPTIVPDPVHGDLAARIYEPGNGATASSGTLRRGVLFLHQGGLVIGDLDTCDTFCTQLAAGLDAVVLSLDYLLAPEHQFPTQNDNVDAAWDWFVDSAGYFGVDVDQLVVCGDSAGGLLAASLCQRLRDAGRPQPAVQALVYPLVDATAVGSSMDSCADAWPLTKDIVEYFLGHVIEGGFDNADPLWNPALRPEKAGVAPAVVVAAAFDVLRDQGIDFAQQLKEAGVLVISRVEETLPHSFLAMGGLSPEASAGCDRVIADIANLLTRHRALGT